MERIWCSLGLASCLLLAAPIARADTVPQSRVHPQSAALLKKGFSQRVKIPGGPRLVLDYSGGLGSGLLLMSRPRITVYGKQVGQKIVYLNAKEKREVTEMLSPAQHLLAGSMTISFSEK